MNITANTRILGVMGYPIAHSLSPAMFNAAFSQLGMDWVYLAYAVKPEYLAPALAGIKSLGLSGVNVTIPFKEPVIEHLDELTPEAGLIGAVNCIAVRGERLIGHNTDGDGFLKSLIKDARYDPRGKRVLVLGAGGAARAVALTLGRYKCREITIANRTIDRAAALAKDVVRETSIPAKGMGLGESELRRAAAESELVVQTSPVGMHPAGKAPEWFDPAWLKPDVLVADIIYRPRPTELLRRSAALGLCTLDGLGMLVYQGALAFSWWTGEEAPVEVMRGEAIRQLGNNRF